MSKSSDAIPVPANQRPNYWRKTAKNPPFPILEGAIEVDVAIVGAGITGLTTALRLKLAGKRVAVIDQYRIGSGETGNTTAHLTEILDTGYQDLITSFGVAEAREIARSKRAAIDQIAAWIDAYGIDCDFQRLPGYLFTENSATETHLRRELNACRRAGINARWSHSIPLPFNTSVNTSVNAWGGIEVSDQAQFHPMKYIAALAQKIQGEGSFVFEQSRLASIHEEGPVTVQTLGGLIRAKDVVLATHTPITNRVLIHTKVAAYRTYAMVLHLRKPMTNAFLAWDNVNPYHYLRLIDPKTLLVGGGDHKTGKLPAAEHPFDDLEAYVRQRFDVETITHHWSGQILEPVDGLPYIGRNPHSENTYIATGYSGNGMTFGTLAGIILSDQILGRPNLWSRLYRPNRIKPLVAATDYISENKDFPTCLIKDRILPAEVDSLSEVPLGEGKIVRHQGKKIAVYRDPQGLTHALSPTCTHLGCHVHWNSLEKSWDCPCHGSRFATDGRVLNGPAKEDLRTVWEEFGPAQTDEAA